MTISRTARIITCLATAVAVIGFASTAYGSDASIKRLVRNYAPKIDVAEGHVVTALGEYKLSGNPTGVKVAIKESIAVLRELRLKILKQGAGTERVQRGKAKLVTGLEAVINSYRHLGVAFGAKRASPQIAQAQAAKALSTVERGRKDLAEGIALLAHR